LAVQALSPLFWILTIIIRLDSPSPGFFHQKRIDKDGYPFVALKFRSMVDKTARMGFGLNVADEDPRITLVGHILRKTSLDKLPQFFNVFIGRMSLRRPRPTLPDQVAITIFNVVVF